MKSIGKKIFLAMFLTVAISLLSLGIFSCLMTANTAKDLAQDGMHTAIMVASERAEWEMTSYINVVKQLGLMTRLSNPSVSLADKEEILEQSLAQFGFDYIRIVDSEGNCSDGNNYSDREYFINAMQGKTTITEPTVSRATGETVMIFAAPLWENGVYGSKPAGCVFAVPDSEFLNDIMREIDISDNSLAYIIDENGNTIADVDSQLVINGENVEEKAKTDSGYADTAAIHAKMRAGETGFETFNENGTDYFIAYAPVEGTDGWSIAVWAPKSDYLGGTYVAIILTIAMIVVACFIGTGISIGLGVKIGKSIKICTERIKRLAQGDLSSPVPEVKSKDETGILAEAAKYTVDGLNNIIGDIRRILGQMSEGNLNVHTGEHADYYIGDYEKLLTYLRDINHKLSHSMAQINVASEQVLVGADQVSDGAQALAQGATEQAASIEELAATINVIAEKTKEAAAAAKNAADKTNQAGGEMGEANNKLDELVAAMQDISRSSEETKKIIKVIEDIAFQTNILALNASVEAARAGAAGKGFAVVATEVRNLAGKSAQAANSTTQLIEDTVAAIEHGSALVGEVADKMVSVAQSAGEVAKLNEDIETETINIADSSAQITIGIEQISAVVQTNSATAEQSAAAAEELSGQATMLKQLVGAFTLRDTDA